MLPLSIRPTHVSLWLVRGGGGYMVAIWLSTAYLQMPCRETLSRSFEAVVRRRLVLTNWIGTVAWTLRGLLALWMI